MSAKTQVTAFEKKVYPLPVSVTMIVFAVVLSFVDLTFLNEVIGKVLDFGTTQSMFVAFTLGLIGIAIMAHQGTEVAHGNEGRRSSASFYMLWVLLGLAFVLVRLFSATFLHLDGSTGDDAIVRILGLNVREVDMILAPLMFFLYLATGILVRDGFKNLFLNPGFDSWWESLIKNRKLKNLKDSKRRKEAEAQVIRDREEARSAREQRMREIQENKRKEKLNRSYYSALEKYRAKEKQIKIKYQKISSNIDFIKSIDKQEKEFEIKVKPSLANIVQASILSVQNSVALAIRNKSGEDIDSLRKAIESHNTSRHG